MKKTILRTTIVVCLAILFAGCAVLTVDVDVYKGPLANHEDIQMEQMAAMAIGAKPLLIELRDRLEAKYMKLVAEHKEDFEAEDCSSDEQIEYYKKWGREDLETRLAKLRELPWYKREFVESTGPDYYSYFRDFNADSVNNILCLYKDRPSREQAKLYELYVQIRDKVYEIIARYVKSYSILRPQDMREDQELAKKVREEVTRDPNAWRVPLIEEILTKKGSRELTKDRTKLDLWDAYERFLSRDRRDALGILEATLAYLKTAEPNSLLLIELKSKQESNEKSLINVTNAAQRLLAETELVDVCADEVFGLKGELRDQFVGRVKQIARAYLDSRAALEDLWLATMDGIIRVNCEPVDPNESADRDEFTAKMVDFSLEIIQPRYLAVLFHKKDIFEDASDLAASLGPYPSAEPNKPSREWAFERMKDVLAVRLKKEPVKTAELLKAIHQFCKYKLDPEKESIKRYVGTGDLSSLAYKEGWRFGLVRAPFGQVPESQPGDGSGSASRPIAEWLTPGGLRQGFAATEPDQGGALAGGRLPKGLETFIEKYLERANVRDPSDDKFHNEELRCARERLSDALVGFAEKLLFLANNRSLISPPKDQGLVMGTVNVLRRSLLGEGRTISFVRLPPLEDTINQDVQDVRILQAVGNSILVQADALHQEKIHAKGLERRAAAEVAALRHTLDQSAEELIDRLVQALEAELTIRAHDPNRTADIAETKRMEQALIAVRNAKYAVLRKIDELGAPVSGATVHDTLRAVLQENQKGLSDSENDKLTAQGIKYALAMLEARPAPIDLNVTDLKLPGDATAKDVRDVWLTLLEYEHDLALRDGDKARAGQVLEAINAARKKREGMIFIRPAMAYLRTSFPATSLQGNPNLTWDNMLAGHAMRSIPFAPQIGEFLDPDAKRDARINAEIDKQFWQNINRVRVAGGGDTNYAVVKDDIGNWYVKSYSANPKDIIESAKGLAMFAAGGPMGTNLPIPSNQTDGAGKAPGTSSSALESVFGKYRDEYRKKTEQEYSLLCAILKEPNAKIDVQIRALWDANVETKSHTQIQDALRTALDWSYKSFVTPFASDLKKNENDTVKQRERIVEGIRRLKQFQDDLTRKITNLNIPKDQPAAPSGSSGQTTNEQTRLGAAKRIVENVVGGRIDTLLAGRRDAIKTYEGALIFLVEAAQQKE